MEIKIISSLAKVFEDEICNCNEITELSCLKNECVSFQLAVKADEDITVPVFCDNEHTAVYLVENVPVGLAAPEDRDEFFIRNAESGDYPDVLIPVSGDIKLKKEKWIAVWCEFRSECEAGIYDIKVHIGSEAVTVKADVCNASLGQQELICTHWFHTDCLASYYNADIFSEDYWRIVENFMAFAVQHGINFILTPLFTPPLDTEVGGERPTVQLVDVKRPAPGKYEFGFERLKRWISVADRCGVKYFEMSHLFTQWGAKHAPKIMAETPSGYKRIFGWETDAHGRAYSNFLRQFAPALIKFIDENGIRSRCMFHTSDEPGLKDYFKYKKSSKIMNELFGEFKIIDALSNFSFYKNGLTKHPIPGIESIDKFAGKVPELWTYFCCGPYKNNYPNRFIAMPSIRTRMLGVIMYKYGVKGFLHWGYNFYFTQYSKGKVDPYKVTDAGGAFSSGDSFVVYPAEDGTPYASLRLKVFYDAVRDYEVLTALENKVGRKKVIEILENDSENPISANVYPKDEAWILSKRREINELLARQKG